MEDNTFLVYEDESGQAAVRNDMVTKIAGLAAISVEGVDSLGNNITAELISVLTNKQIATGIEVIPNESGVDVYIALVIKMGYSIPEVCKNVQLKVRSEVQDMLGVKVGEVNLRVANLKVEK